MARLIVLLLGVILVLNAATFLLVAVPSSSESSETAGAATGATNSDATLKRVQRQLDVLTKDVSQMKQTVSRLPKSLSDINRRITSAGQSAAAAERMRARRDQLVGGRPSPVRSLPRNQPPVDEDDGAEDESTDEEEFVPVEDEDESNAPEVDAEEDVGAETE